MSLNKSITYGKEHRKPYQGAKEGNEYDIRFLC